MTTLAQVRDGLFARLDTIDGLRVYKHVPENAHYPAALIFPPTVIDYRNDLDLRSFTVRMIVMLLVPATVDRQQLDLYAFIDRSGPASIFAAVAADSTLGGLNVSARVVAASDPLDLGEMAGANVYQRAVTVEVIVTN
jgi:hypothetical protein